MSIIMAEGDINPTTDLTELFNCATTHLESLVSQLNSNQLLSFYGLFKQATVGPCDISRPNWYQVQAKQKWEAWYSLGDMSRELAMAGYIRKMTEIDPDWEHRAQVAKQKNKSWVTVSCLHNDEEELRDVDKTLLDWIKDSNEKEVWQALSRDKSQVNVPDDDGMFPIHWAADRGHVSIIRMLIEADANKDAADEDGQTPLHYAASCGHADVVKYLLSIGANILEDNNGVTPKDIALKELISLF